MEEVIKVFITCYASMVITFIIIPSVVLLLLIITEKIRNRIKYGKTNIMVHGCKSIRDFYDDAYDKDEIINLYPDVTIKDMSIINIKLIE